MRLSTKSLAYDGENPFKEVVIYQQVLVDGVWVDHVESISPWSPVFRVEIENTGIEPVGPVMVFEAVACNAGLLFSRVGPGDDWGCVNEGLYFKVIDTVPPGSSVVFEHEFNLKDDVENGSYYCVAHAAVTTPSYFEADDISPYKEVNQYFAIDVDWAQTGGSDGTNDGDESDGGGEGNSSDEDDSGDVGNGGGETGDGSNNDDTVGSMEDTSNSMGEVQQFAPENSANIGHLAENRTDQKNVDTTQDSTHENYLASSGAELVFAYLITGIILICYNIFYVSRCKRRSKAKPV